MEPSIRVNQEGDVHKDLWFFVHIVIFSGSYGNRLVWIPIIAEEGMWQTPRLWQKNFGLNRGKVAINAIANHQQVLNTSPHHENRRLNTTAFGNQTMPLSASQWNLQACTERVRDEGCSCSGTFRLMSNAHIDRGH